MFMETEFQNQSGLWTPPRGASRTAIFFCAWVSASGGVRVLREFLRGRVEVVGGTFGRCGIVGQWGFERGFCRVVLCVECALGACDRGGPLPSAGSASGVFPWAAFRVLLVFMKRGGFAWRGRDGEVRGWGRPDRAALRLGQSEVGLRPSCSRASASAGVFWDQYSGA